MSLDNHVKVIFPLERDEDDWPPAGEESIWAEVTDEPEVVRLANTPFFVRGVAWGDRVHVRRDANDGSWQYEALVQESGHSTVRIVLSDEGYVSKIHAKLAELGCEWTGIRAFPNLIAVDVPPGLPYGPLRAWLDEGEKADRLGFEEGCISAHHRAGWDQTR
ncbi:hypothetical protein Misp01_54380 [Microtetraspora sp. NBRC 13810]|uniref:DUF4265 domain-containing protein n=1 Tax=Microtetraspora sp. NBRC 13810 TaxID=3030990 RepID=UPI0024A2BB36|nr:DUF4265 domain-containing protein [Microtetraspora sp. NBRC 13810]GLW10310.1 hypothetical protein Misp01_54380 [Microtetraspora sp. NBRC 13810]